MYLYDVSTLNPDQMCIGYFVVFESTPMRIGLFISRPHAVVEDCTICHLSGIKWHFHMQAVLICCLMLTFLMDMQCKRLSHENNFIHFCVSNAVFGGTYPHLKSSKSSLSKSKLKRFLDFGGNPLLKAAFFSPFLLSLFDMQLNSKSLHF